VILTATLFILLSSSIECASNRKVAMNLVLILSCRVAASGAARLAVRSGQCLVVLSLLAFSLIVGLPKTAAAAVTRGPYLQQGTTNSLVVRWRTDVAAESYARFGPGPGNFMGGASNTTATTEHIVALTGLQPDTRYYYEVGNAGGWYPGNANSFFVTPPPIGTPKPTRIWAIGDSGTANADAAAVRDAYITYTGTRNPDLWLMLGDNAYSSGLDTEYQAAVFDMYPTILSSAVLWPTLGNHDAGSTGPNGLPPYFDMFTLPQNGEAGGLASGTEYYYSFDYANIHFICLDSQTSDRSSNGPMCNWLTSDIASTLQDWVIAFWHKPPYSKGSHDSDADSTSTDFRQNVLPILEGYGVDLVLSGHSHSYERSFLLDGHYGLSTTLTAAMKLNPGDGREDGNGAYMKPAGRSAHEGAVYTVAGCSGKTSGGSLDHPAMFYSASILGSVVIDITGNRLDLVFLLTNGLRGDYFTLSKAPPPTNAPAAPSNLVASAVSSTQINLSWADNSDNEAGFKLERSTNGLDFVQFATVNAGVTNASDSGLAPSTTYYYQVRAFNVVGNSADTGIAQARTLDPPPDTIPPAAVTNLTIASVSSNSVSLLWTAPGDDGNTGTAARYDLRYSTAQITDANWDSATLTSGVPPPVKAGASQSFTVNGLSSGITYYFALKTSDETNNVSPLSNVPNTTTATAILQPPAAPTALRAAAVSSGEIDLTWTDHANNEDGFKIERSSNGVDFAQISTVGMNVTSAADPSVQPGSTNYYRVRAYNAGGDSAYSNTNSAVANSPTSTNSFVTLLIASNSVWKYLDTGTDQSNFWTQAAFDDSSWQSGPAQFGYGFSSEATLISYGPNSSAKYITTYFRRHFFVDDPSIVSSLIASVQRDAGAVVYLNGQEVFRSNMPLTGSIDYMTLAPQSLSGSAKTAFYNSPFIDPDELLRGDNIIAVEVHQHSGSSSQMNFDLQLIATNTQAPTRVTVASSANPTRPDQPDTFTASVVNASSGAQVTLGTVTFMDGDTQLTGTLPLNSSGHASFTTNQMSTGTHTITASYSGSPGHYTASSGALVVNVCSDTPFACPSDIIVTATGRCPAVVAFNLPGGSGCSLSNLMAHPASGSAFPIGTNVVTVTATDPFGNTNMCAFQVIVLPGAAPTLKSILQGNNLVLSWPASFGCYILQFAPAIVSPLSAMDWRAAAIPLQTNNGTIFATETGSPTNRFYRLTSF